MTSESFTLDMEPFSHLMTNKDLNSSSRNNSNLSTKESQIRVDKMNSNCLANEDNKDVIPSSRGSLMGCTMSIKLMLVNQTNDHIPNPEVRRQISIETTGATTKKPATTPTKRIFSGKKSCSFKQSSIISPRKILFFFATLSSIGTFLLICLNLSMAKYNEDCNL